MLFGKRRPKKGAHASEPVGIEALSSKAGNEPGSLPDDVPNLGALRHGKDYSFSDLEPGSTQELGALGTGGPVVPNLPASAQGAGAASDPRAVHAAYAGQGAHASEPAGQPGAAHMADDAAQGASPDSTAKLPGPGELAPPPNPYLAAGTDGADGAPIDASLDAGSALDPEEQDAYEQLKRMRAQRRRKKMIRRGIVAGVIAVVALAIGIWRLVSTQQPEQTVQVVTQPVYSGPFTSEVTGSGSIKPLSSTVVSPGIDGTVDEVKVVAGQQVSEGDVLFTIKNDDLDRAISEADRNVRTAKSQLDQANQQLSQASQQLKDAKAALSSAGSTTTDAVDASGAKEAVNSAQQAYDSAKSGVDSAKIQVESANEAKQKAQEQADKRTVKAPSSGSVIELNAQPGASVAQASAGATGGGSGALCQIADLSQMTVTVQINEVDINKIQVGQAATATFSAVSDATLDATVRSVATTSSSDASGAGYGGYGGGNGVTYAVDLVIPTPDQRLKPGMTANVSIVTTSIDNALVVPTAAVNDLGDGTGMLLVEDDAETHSAHTVTVNVLATNGSEMAVEPAEGSTLSDGDAVIVSGSEAANVTGDGGLGASTSTGDATMSVDPAKVGSGEGAVTSIEEDGSGSGTSGTSGSGTSGSSSSYVTYDEGGNVTGAGGSAKVD